MDGWISISWPYYRQLTMKYVWYENNSYKVNGLKSLQIGGIFLTGYNIGFLSAFPVLSVSTSNLFSSFRGPAVLYPYFRWSWSPSAPSVSMRFLFEDSRTQRLWSILTICSVNISTLCTLFPLSINFSSVSYVTIFRSWRFIPNIIWSIDLCATQIALLVIS